METTSQKDEEGRRVATQYADLNWGQFNPESGWLWLATAFREPRTTHTFYLAVKGSPDIPHIAPKNIGVWWPKFLDGATHSEFSVLQHKTNGNSWHVGLHDTDYGKIIVDLRSWLRKYWHKGFQITLPDGEPDLTATAIPIVSPENRAAKLVETANKALESGNISKLIYFQKELSKQVKELEHVLEILDVKKKQVDQKIKGWIE